ncbi:ribosome maturation factor RimP [Brachybacterium hainanense]|uniref:Ribosome maturation factor RimP n=1 Tax=Brachybacterium hainanense TaxID=1541174 RepID=A0ABV6RJM9_9MICO
MNDEQTIPNLDGPVSSILAGHELVLEELAMRRRGGALEIRVVVDLPEDRIGSADLDTVAEASREISELLDADESLIGPGPSVLEVTTPGAERPLTEPRHFRRARTRLIRLVRTDGTELLARLEDVDGDVLRLRPQRPLDSRGRPQRLPEGTPEVLDLPIADVERARVEIEFSAPAGGGAAITENPAKER